ncbi:MAG: glycosyltransferase family 1 protein [Betaproteobacteria bacterium]|nr:glycosyltransferase family 1 protein [Betaproteobacteria bacterium]
MKILFYNVTAASLHGGLETYCWEAGRALARRGHQVVVCAGAAGPAWHDEVQLVQFPYRPEKDWPDLGTRFRRLMERLSFARHSLGHVVQGGYDAVVVNKPFDFPILWRARKQGFAGRTVFRSGGTDFFAGDRWFDSAIDRWASSSRYNAAQVEARYGHKVTVIHNGVDAGRFLARAGDAGWRQAIGLPADAFVLMSVGRLVGLKGLRVIVEALPGLAPHICFVIVGEGPERSVLEGLAADRGVASRVHFAGRVLHAALPGVLARADLFLQPTIGEEAFGISVVEAMACAVPVLASVSGGLPEIVADGVTGRLLLRGNTAAWQGAIAAAEADRPALARWGAAGRARVEAEFTWAANAAKLEALIAGRNC